MIHLQRSFFFRQPQPASSLEGFEILILFLLRSMILRFHCFASLNNFCTFFRNLMEVFEAPSADGGIQIWAVKQWAVAPENLCKRTQLKIYFSAAHTRSAYTRSHYKLYFHFNSRIFRFLYVHHVSIYNLSSSLSLFPSWIPSTIVELFNIF